MVVKTFIKIWSLVLIGLLFFISKSYGAEAIKAVFDMTSSGNSYIYLDLTNVTNYTIASGDYLEYEVYWISSPVTSEQIAIDYTCTDATYLRGAASDQNGLASHPNTDLSAYALNTWYHRKIALPAGHVGKVISYYDLVCENNDTAVKTGYFRNILITDGAGTTRKTIWTSGSFTYAIHLQSNGAVNSFTNITLSPVCTITSPDSASGQTYNDQPFILIRSSDAAYNIDDMRVMIDNNNDFLSPEYDVWASNDNLYSEFSNLGIGSDITAVHRVDSALAVDTYYMRAMAWNDNTSDRMSAWSPTVQITIAAASWTDPTITAGTTLIKGPHFNELKTVIDNLRLFRGSGAYGWDSSWTGGLDNTKLIKIININNLRNALTTPYNEATGTDPTFTAPEPEMTSGILIRKIHIQELRDKSILP